MAALMVAAMVALHTDARAFSSVPGTCSFGATLPSPHLVASPGTGGYSLAVSDSVYSPGEVLTVTLNGTTAFRGLLLYAFDAGGNHVGTFTAPSGFQLMSSCPATGSTLGHASSTTKTVPRNFTWTAPSSGSTLTFVAAVVVNTSQWFATQPVTIRSDVQTGVPLDRGMARGSRIEAKPDPFHAETTIECVQAESGIAEVRIYQLDGRLVRTLFRGERAAGAWSLAWDGRTDDGSTAGPGVYFLQLETPGGVSAGKVIRTAN